MEQLRESIISKLLYVSLMICIQEMRRDQTRMHRMGDVSENLRNQLQLNGKSRPVFQGILRQCLSDRCTDHMLESEKNILIAVINAYFQSNSREESESNGSELIRIQDFKV